MDLGWSKFKTYINIVIPFLRSSIITAFVLVTTLSFDDFIITSLSHHALSVPNLTACKKCGTKIQTHRVCSNCGYYKENNRYCKSLIMNIKKNIIDKPKHENEKEESRIVAMSFCEPRSWIQILPS